MGFYSRVEFSKRICKLRNIVYDSIVVRHGKDRRRRILLQRFSELKISREELLLLLLFKGKWKIEVGRTRADFEAIYIYGWIRWKGRFVKRFNSCRTPTALWRGVYYRFSPSNSDAMLVQPRGKRLIRNPSNSFAHVKPHKTRGLTVCTPTGSANFNSQFLWKTLFTLYRIKKY